MIGLALVTLVSVLATGLKSTFENSVNQIFNADYALTATNNFSPVSIASAQALQGVPGVLVVAGVRAGQGRAFGSEINVSGVPPDISRVIDVKWQAGSQAVPGELGADGAFVSKDYAKELHLHVGSPIAVETPAGRVMHLYLRGIFAPPKGGSPYGDVTISTQRFDAEYENPQNVYTFVNIAGGATAANTQLLERALAGFPDAKIQTESQFKSSQEEGINTLLNLLYVLLSLSIVVSLFGIVNTLVLTVFERTRELGMLRAIGMTRRQLRRMIRHESIVTALIGAALGIPVGIVLAIMVGQAIEYPTFTIPVGTLVVFVIAAILAGMLAAIFPARRAARLNVLRGAAVRVATGQLSWRVRCRHDRSRYRTERPRARGRPPGTSSRSSTARARPACESRLEEALERGAGVRRALRRQARRARQRWSGGGDGGAGGDLRAPRPRRLLRRACASPPTPPLPRTARCCRRCRSARRRSGRRCCSSSSSGPR